MADDPEKSNERGFTIIDRRGGRDEEATAEEKSAAAEAAEAARQGPELPRIDFSTFVVSLASSALYHMGLATDPRSGEPAPQPDLVLARQTIDTLEMLQEKTRGNLTGEEERLLDHLLYELRMGFVEATKSGK